MRKTTLTDSPLQSLILPTTPKKLLLLGSGQTPIPSDWPDLPSIRFNLHTLCVNLAPNSPPFAVVVNRAKRARFCKTWWKQFDPKPYGFCINSHLEQDDFSPDSKVPIKIGATPDRDLGSFYNHWRSEIQKRNGRYLKLSIGFYATIWLLSEHCDEIYMAGFDGYMKKPRRHYLYSTASPSSKHHDLTTEWEGIEEAIAFARQSNKTTVHLAKEDPNDKANAS